MRKKILSLVLCVAMLASMGIIPAVAAEPEATANQTVFTDTAGHWGETSINRWSQYGVISGEGNGKFNPNGDLSRAAMATILTKLLGLTEKAPNTYADVNPDAWYADAVLKCTAAGIMKGDGANANPGADISRQEAMVMLGRALGIQPAKVADLSAFADADKVAPWAAGYVTALTKAGIVSGVGDHLVAPVANMSRAAVMKVLDKAVSDYINVAGTYHNLVGTGIVVVTAPNILLKNNKIAGSLLIAEGVGDGEFTLDGTNVAGNTTVRGGGVNSFVVKGGSKLGDVTIARVDGAVRIVTSGGSTIETAYIDDGKDDVIMEGSFGNVSVAGEVPVTLKGADVKTVTATGKNADITVDKNSKVVTVATAQENTKITVAGTVTNVAATAEASGVKLNVAKGGTATNVATAATGSVIKNDGNLGSLAIAKGADTVFAKGENATKTNITAADKTDLGVTTIAAQDAKEAVAKAAADKLAAEQLAAAAKTDAEKAAAQAAADKAAADKAAADKAQEESKKEEDKVKEDTKVEEKPVTPPVVDEDKPGEIVVPKPIEPKPDPKPDRPTPPPYVDLYTHVSTAEGLAAALAGTATKIQIDNTIGSTEAYTAYYVARPVEIKGGTVYGSFVVTADGVTFDGVTVYNKGDTEGQNTVVRNAINAACKALTIRNCNFKMVANTGITNGVSIWPTDTAVVFNIDHNTFEGYATESQGYSSSALLISGGVAKEAITGISAASQLANLTSEQDLAIITGNTFTGCSIDYCRDDWSSGNNVISCTANSFSDNFRLSYAANPAKFYVSGNVTIETNTTVQAGSELIVMAGKTLTIPAGKTLTNNGTITNSGTIVVNDEAGLRMALAVGGNVKLGKDITLAAGIDTSVNNLTLDGNGKTITFGGSFVPVYESRGLLFQGKDITIKDLTIASGGVTYPLAIHRFGDAETVTATLTNVIVNDAGKTALDIACVSKLMLNNVSATAGTGGFGMVLDAVSNISGTGSSIQSVSIHNKWGAITNVDLTNLGVTSVVVEDFSQTGYNYGDDTENKGNYEGWKIFTAIDSTSKTFADNTVTLPTELTTITAATENTQRAYKVTFTAPAPQP